MEAEKQVAQEAAEIAAAPRIERGVALFRCHWCGALAREVRLVERIGGVVQEDGSVLGGVERYKGVDCCGG